MRKALLLLPVLTACEVPLSPITEGEAYRTPEPATYIAGTIEVLDGTSREPGGPAILFRFDCDAPPPPTGISGPLDIVAIPESAFAAGVANFTIPGVPADSCSLLTGHLDRDGDFDLFYSMTTQPTAGDLSFVPREVSVGPADAGGWVAPVEGLQVRAETVVPLDKPCFEAVFRDYEPPPGQQEGILFEFELGNLGGTRFIELYADGLDSDIQDVDDPLFTVVFAPDIDQDGLPDDLGDDGLPDLLFPAVVFRKLDEDDPTGLTLDEDDPVIIPLSGLPMDPLDPLGTEFDMLTIALESGLPFDGTSPFTTDRLLLAMQELVLVDRATRTTRTVADWEAETGGDATGLYQMMVMNSSGQLWAIPNELAGFGIPEQGRRMRITRPPPD